MVYTLKKTLQFKSSLELAKKRGLEISLLEDIVNHNHDWLLLYYKDKDVLTLTVVDTGRYSDIFNN